MNEDPDSGFFFMKKIMARTIIISNRLPVKILKEEGTFFYMPSEGGLATGLGSIYKSGKNLWIGWPGIATNKPEEKEEIEKALLEENMVPVFLSKKLRGKGVKAFISATSLKEQVN